MTTELFRRDWILLRRDLILTWRVMLPSILFYTAFQVWIVREINHPTLWLVFICVYMTFLTVIPINVDDKAGTNAWSCTLPVTRADLVRGRYVTAWALIALMFTLAILVATFVPGSKLSAEMILNPNSLLLTMGIATFILAPLIPFTLKFGMMGVMLMLVVFQVLGAGLFVVARLTGAMDAVEGGIAAPFRVVIGGVTAFRDNLPALAFQLVVLAALVLVNAASYRFALAIFRRKEL
jgi:hypothetical protein